MEERGCPEETLDRQHPRPLQGPPRCLCHTLGPSHTGLHFVLQTYHIKDARAAHLGPRCTPVTEELLGFPRAETCKHAFPLMTAWLLVTFPSGSLGDQ